jgi:hypothetical protein
MADLGLTLSGEPPVGQEQSSGRADGNRGIDTKIAISGFPRSRLFDGARAPYRREIEDGLKSLAAREAPAPRPESGQGYRVVTLAGHNVGASMVLGNEPPPPRAAEPEPPRVAANVNSNVQSVNNSSMEGSTLSAGSPGVHVDIRNALEEPEAATPTPPPKEEDKAKEPVRRPPRETSAAAGGGEADGEAEAVPARADDGERERDGGGAEAEARRLPVPVRSGTCTAGGDGEQRRWRWR